MEAKVFEVSFIAEQSVKQAVRAEVRLTEGMIMAALQQHVYMAMEDAPMQTGEISVDGNWASITFKMCLKDLITDAVASSAYLVKEIIDTDIEGDVGRHVNIQDAWNVEICRA